MVKPVYAARGSGMLDGMAALIAGGDSELAAQSRSFTRDGADVAITCLPEHIDAEETKCAVEAAALPTSSQIVWGKKPEANHTSLFVASRGTI